MANATILGWRRFGLEDEDGKKRRKGRERGKEEGLLCYLSSREPHGESAAQKCPVLVPSPISGVAAIMCKAALVSPIAFRHREWGARGWTC